MKFIINREQLLAPLQQIVSVIEKRQTLPILSNVVLDIKDNHLILKGSDTEIQMIAKIPLDLEYEVGDITVPARKFLDLCRLLPSNALISCDIQDVKLKLQSARSRFLLNTLPAEHYPTFDETHFDHQFLMNAGQLKQALDKTLFCMANQDVRYYLNGLLLHISNSTARLIASDGHRMAIFVDSLAHETGYESRLILPRKAVQELSRLLDDADAEVTIDYSDNQIKVLYKNIVFSSKLIDAKFPDFNRVFDQEFLEPIIVQRQLLRETLTRVVILANEKFKGVTFEMADDVLKVTAHNPEHDEAEEELELQYQGKPLKIAFNAQYILDAISNIDSDVVSLNLSNDLSSCFIQEPTLSPYRYIIMPMRL